jgi:hypothetical protein
VTTTVQQASEEGPLSIGNRCRALSPRGGKGSLLGLFADSLLPFLYLLDESFRFLLIGKGETGGAVFEFEGMKKGSILVICEVVVEFLVPNHTSSGGL